MSRIEELKRIVEETGTPKMKEIVLITEKYLKGLDNMFKDRDVDEFVLKEFDLPMFLWELKKEGSFENKSGMQMRLLVMDVYYVARHTWELTDNNGVLKNGNDLRKAWPLMYENDEMMSIEALAKDMHHL